MCLIDSTYCKPQWGQLLSICIEIFPCHSSTATNLCMIDQRKTISLRALVLCLMTFHLGKVKGDFIPPLIRNPLLEDHLLCNPFPSLFGWIGKKNIASSHHQWARSQIVNQTFQKKLNWVNIEVMVHCKTMFENQNYICKIDYIKYHLSHKKYLVNCVLIINNSFVAFHATMYHMSILCL